MDKEYASMFVIDILLLAMIMGLLMFPLILIFAIVM